MFSPKRRNQLQMDQKKKKRKFVVIGINFWGTKGEIIILPKTDTHHKTSNKILITPTKMGGGGGGLKIPN